MNFNSRSDLLVLHGTSRSSGSLCKPAGGPYRGASPFHSGRGCQSHSPGPPPYERRSMRSPGNSQAQLPLHPEGVGQAQMDTRITLARCDQGLAQAVRLCRPSEQEGDETAMAGCEALLRALPQVQADHALLRRRRSLGNSLLPGRSRVWRLLDGIQPKRSSRAVPNHA